MTEQQSGWDKAIDAVYAEHKSPYWWRNLRLKFRLWRLRRTTTFIEVGGSDE